MAGIHEPGSGFMTGSGIMGSGSAFDWPTEERFWQGQFPDLSYINADRTYDFYVPAFRFGAESAALANGRTWDEMEPELRRSWASYPHKPAECGTFEEMRPAIHHAWHSYGERNPSARRASQAGESRDASDRRL